MKEEKAVSQITMKDVPEINKNPPIQEQYKMAASIDNNIAGFSISGIYWYIQCCNTREYQPETSKWKKWFINSVHSYVVPFIH